MKKLKVTKFLLGCLLLATMFFGVDKVYAFSEGQICSAEEPHPGYHWIWSGGECRQVYCADQATPDPVYKEIYKKIALQKVFTDVGVGSEKYKLNSEKTKQLILKLGGAKYYFENVAAFSKINYDLRLKLRFAQVAMWDVMNEFYGKNIWTVVIDDYYIGSDVRDSFKTAYSEFGTWFDENKEYLTVDGNGWAEGNQPLLQLEVEYNPFPPTDFGVDVACENCDSKIADSKAIVIQDSNDWDAILKSDSSAAEKACGNDNIKTYFKREDGVYCREEFYIYYPNANNKIEIQLGRYFIVNEENVPATAVDIPVWEPIKVKKIKQCKATDDTKLKNFKKKSDTDFLTCGGTVKLQYEGADPYNKKFTLTGRYVSGKSSISDGLLTQEAVFAYTLPSGTYQLVRREDGVSVDKKSTIKDLDKYIDLGISNLPVPFKNGTNSVKVRLSYSLPTSSKLSGMTGNDVCTDSYSNISKAFEIKNDKVVDNLTCKNNKDSGGKKIYSPYKNNKTPWKTSCAKLYNVKKEEFDSTGKYVGKSNIKNGAYETCVSERANSENNIGKCFTSKDDYLCTINVGCVCNQVTAGKKISDKCDFSKLEWNSTLKMCVNKQKKSCSKDDGHYYDKDGKETTREVYIKECCDSAKEADELGVEWDPTHDICCPDEQIYSSEDHKCCPPNEYDDGTGKCSGKPPLCDAEHIKDYPGMVIIDGACCEESSVVTVNNKKACCTIDTYSKLGLDWDKVNQKCCPSGYKFSDDTQKCMPDDEGICGNLKCGDRPCCGDGSSYYCGWITESGEKVCSGKPVVPFDELVYRDINVNAAFVDESGEYRSRTGLNWCSAVAVGDKDSLANCATRPENNTVIQKVISNGNSGDKEKAAYVVKLDATAIDEIRKYNKNNEYSDFTLKCEKGFCYSSFLKQYSQYVSGKCKNDASSYYKYATCNSK